MQDVETLVRICRELHKRHPLKTTIDGVSLIKDFLAIIKPSSIDPRKGEVVCFVVNTSCLRDELWREQVGDYADPYQLSVAQPLGLWGYVLGHPLILASDDQDAPFMDVVLYDGTSFRWNIPKGGG